MSSRNLFSNLVIYFSSAHYHVLSGLFLAFDIYRPKFSVDSPYIIDTYRNHKDFLYVAAGLWAVCRSVQITSISYGWNYP